ncbi:MAG: dual specificity protein phosphatase family protein [Prolixibacteraceae bacterium]|nr:dual specificity protein phosphatase family protein [Prolixibacteraceae bacterium]MBN2772966.1 dual specificity protein phosphatase family protein [Prolixibacteraceae bacterium]
MKKTTLTTTFLFVLACLIYPAKANFLKIKNQKKLPVIPIENFQNMYQWGDLYLSGQPSLDALEWIKKQGVGLIINLRTDDEMNEFKQTAFDEEKMAGELGIGYISVPIGGMDAYSPENLVKFKEALSEENGKILIHCRSCGRVTYFLMSYLIRFDNFSIDDAISIGKQLKYSFPLEDLLGEKITMSIVN